MSRRPDWVNLVRMWRMALKLSIPLIYAEAILFVGAAIAYHSKGVTITVPTEFALHSMEEKRRSLIRRAAGTLRRVFGIAYQTINAISHFCPEVDIQARAYREVKLVNNVGKLFIASKIPTALRVVGASHWHNKENSV